MNIAVVDRREKPGHISDAEWQTRLDLAACYRLIDHIGMSDQVYNHITASVPGSAEAGKKLFLINHYGLRYAEITASSLIKVDLDGNIHDAPDHPVLGPAEINPAGYVIHACVHAARPEVKCVLHTHSRAGLGVSCLKEGFMALDQGGLQFHNAIAYHDYEGMAVDLDEQARLVHDLGDKSAMILRNHGLLTCGRSIPEAYRKMYYLERACQLQMDVLQTGREINLPTGPVMEHTAQQWQQGAAGIGTGEEATREWPALLRMLDAKDPSWRG